MASNSREYLKRRRRVLAEAMHIAQFSDDDDTLNNFNQQDVPMPSSSTFHHQQLQDVDSSPPKSIECDLESDLDLDTDSDIDFQSWGSDYGSETDEQLPQTDDSDTTTLSEKLAAWATRNGLTRSSVNELLEILRDEELPLPKDARTLLQTPREIPTEDKCGGKYAYFGIRNGLIKSLQLSSNPTVPHKVDLLVNIDGVPLFKSSGAQFWPILCSFDNHKPFLVALFYGPTKPTSRDDYLHDFLEEYSTIKNHGILYNDAVVAVNIKAFVCDAHARSFLKSTKGHSGYFSCERCEVKGTYEDNRVVLHVDGDFAPRTDDTFKDQRYFPDHQTGISPLTGAAINFPCVTGFCLDYMHLVCLGVVRRILNFWKNGPAVCKLSQQQRKEISTDLVSFVSKLPSEFARKPRPLNEIDHWKATELRQFLLYTGPVVLKNILHKTMYEHFLCLSVAVSMLLDEDNGKRNHYLDYTQRLFRSFVENSSEIYSRSFPVYNVHNLLHLTEDSRHFNSSLNSISSFPFENHLQILKRLVKSGTNPIGQVAKRIVEIESAGSKSSTAYSCLAHIAPNKRNGCLLLDNEDFAFVREKRKDVFLCDVISNRHTENLYTKPLQSKTINVVQITVNAMNRSHQKLVSTEEIRRKVVCLPYGRGYVLAPLLHGIEKYKI